MIIQTLDQSYEVIRRWEKNPDQIEYLCRRPGDGQKPSCLMEAFRSDALPREELVSFMELRNRNAAEDFKDCFLKNGFIYLVFAYEEGELLQNRLEEELSIRERLEISRSLMEQIVGKGLSDYLLYETLFDEHVKVSRDGRISFHYFLREPEQMGRELYPAICSRLALWLEQLFFPELLGNRVKDLEEFLDRLQEGEYGTYGEIYQEYRSIYEGLTEREKAGELAGEPLLPRLWIQVKAAFSRMYGLAGWLLLALALACTVYFLLLPEKTDTPVTFSRIGEIFIETDLELSEPQREQ